MTKQNVIDKFHLFMDDSTELSSSEESDLFDKIYQQVCNDRPWEVLKKAYTGVIANDGTNYYVTKPADFNQFLQNNNYSDDSYIAGGPVVFVGSAYTPYKIVSWSDRRQYRNQTGYAYLDLVLGKIIFTGTPNTGDAVEYDYKFIPPNLATTDSIALFPIAQDVFYHGMCADEFIIEQSDKAKSYRNENLARYQDFLADMALWNANLVQM